MGSDAAAVRELQIELVLATRKLDARSNHTGVSLGFFGGIDGSIVPSAKPVQAIEAAVHLSGHLFRSAKAQRLRISQSLTKVHPPRLPAEQCSQRRCSDFSHILLCLTTL